METVTIKKLSLRVEEDGEIVIPGDTATITTPAHVATVAHRMIGNRPTEHLLLLPVDSNMLVTSAIVVAAGSSSRCEFSATDILRAVLTCHCSAFFLAHNHPSGNAAASPEDRTATARLLEACEVIGIRMLDHLIVTRHAQRWSIV